MNNLKKKGKIALVSFSLLLLLLGGSWIAIKLRVKNVEVAQDEKVDNLVETEYKLSLPGDENTGKSENIDTSGGQSANEIADLSSSLESDTSVSLEPLTASIQSASLTTNEGSATTELSVTSGDTAEKLTVSEVLEMYRVSFIDLEKQAQANINSLISLAMDEYQIKKQNGEKVSYFYFYAKYSDAGTALETKTDVAFQVIYKELQNELVKNNIDKNEASVFLEDYNKTKKQLRKTLITKATEALL